MISITRLTDKLIELRGILRAIGADPDALGPLKLRGLDHHFALLGFRFEPDVELNRWLDQEIGV